MTLALAGVEQERHCGGRSYANIEMPPDGKVKAIQIEIFFLTCQIISWWATRSIPEGTLRSALTLSASQKL